MLHNRFFEKKGPFPLKELIKVIGYTGKKTYENDFKIFGIESLKNADKNDMTFLNSSKYQEISLKTKAAATPQAIILFRFCLAKPDAIKPIMIALSAAITISMIII